jgi:hypothetical protein
MLDDVEKLTWKQVGFFLTTVLIYSANKIDCFLIKLKLSSMLSAFSGKKISPISADKKGTVFIRSCTHLLTSIPALCGYAAYWNFSALLQIG